MARTARLRRDLSSSLFSGRTVLITGGTGGVGLEAARALRSHGAEIIIGSRDPGRYSAASAELGNEGVHPFIADVTDYEQAMHAVELMQSSGLEPTDVIHAAAGGLEPILRDMVRLLTGLKKLRGVERDQAHAAAIRELAPIVAASREMAMNVNCVAPSKLLDSLIPRLPTGASVIFYSSIWSSFYPHRQVPVYYQNVAATKRAMEIWLENRARIWASQAITTAIISSTWIADTRIGQVLDRFCAEIMPPVDRARWRSTYVNCSDLVDATLGVLDRSRSSPSGGLVRLYLPGPGEIVNSMGPDDSPLQYPVPLAENAPTWSD